MLKKRISAVIVLKDQIAVQSMGFNTFLPIGHADISAEFLNDWGADEIVVLDIDASKKGVEPNYSLINKISKKCFVPLAVGGGIKTLEEARTLIQSGADKIIINTSFLKNPELITRIAEVLGVQCVVVSLDFVKNLDKYEIFSHAGVKPILNDPIALAKLAEILGAGELLINSVERDGSKTGFDIQLIKEISGNINIPVIACGGAGKPEHFYDLFKNTNASAAAAGNYFNFSEHSLTIVKSYLKEKGVKLRFDSDAKYNNFKINEIGRLDKKSDEYLDQQRFDIYRPEEI